MMVEKVPGIWDESLEWEQTADGNWERKPQRFVQVKRIGSQTGKQAAVITV
jgi:hypothetical protein